MAIIVSWIISSDQSEGREKIDSLHVKSTNDPQSSNRCWKSENFSDFKNERREEKRVLFVPPLPGLMTLPFTNDIGFMAFASWSNVATNSSYAFAASASASNFFCFSNSNFDIGFRLELKLKAFILSPVGPEEEEEDPLPDLMDGNCSVIHGSTIIDSRRLNRSFFLWSYHG